MARGSERFPATCDYKRSRVAAKGRAIRLPLLVVRYVAAQKRGDGKLFLVNHLPGHAAVDHEIRPRDKTGALTVEEKCDNLGDILGLPNPAGRVLQMILAPQ